MCNFHMCNIIESIFGDSLKGYYDTQSFSYAQEEHYVGGRLFSALVFTLDLRDEIRHCALRNDTSGHVSRRHDRGRL